MEELDACNADNKEIQLLTFLYILVLLLIQRKTATKK